MNSLPQRALFFGAGLAFGVFVGWLLAQSSGTPAVPARAGRAPTPAPPPASAPPPAPEAPLPVDEARLEELLAAVEADPEDPAARVAVGDLYFASREYRDAAYWYRQARNLDPSDLDIRASLGFTLLARGEVAGAIAEYEGVLAEDPGHPDSLLALGRLRLYVEQDIAGGIALWERYLEAAPDSAEADGLRQAIRALREAHPG